MRHVTDELKRLNELRGQRWEDDVMVHDKKVFRVVKYG